MKIQVFCVPYDSGHLEERMGRGPTHFVTHGLEDRLRTAGHEVRCDRLTITDPFSTEIKTAFTLHRLLADGVRAACQAGEFPLVFSGNCGSALGTVAGLGGADDLGVIWFDAHGDFNTPETTQSGFLDGMGLAAVTGQCWCTLTASIPGFRPVPARHVMHLGGRDFDPAEQKLLTASGVLTVGAQPIRQIGVLQALQPTLAALQPRVRRLYIHLDLDVLDSATFPANQFLPPDGLFPDQVEASIRLLGQHFQIAGGGVAAYDPAFDVENRTLEAGYRLVTVLLSVASARHSADSH
jgi:arginase